MDDFEIIITDTLILLYLPVVFVYLKYLSDKQRFNRFERIIFFSITFLFMPVFIGLIAFKFSGLIVTWTGFGVGVVGLILVNLLFIFGQHLSEAYLGWRIKRRREKISNMPDGPKKQKMEREQEFMEELWKNH